MPLANRLSGLDPSGLSCRKGSPSNNTCILFAENGGNWKAYPEAQAKGLLIGADAGGRNGRRLRRREVELRAFADEAEFGRVVRHLPAGTRRWIRMSMGPLPTSARTGGRPSTVRGEIVSRDPVIVHLT